MAAVVVSSSSVRSTWGEYESSGRRVDPVTVKLEHGVAAQHEKELLVRSGVVLCVLVDDEVARGTGRPSSYSERRDTQVVSDRPIVTACVAEFLNIVQMRDLVTNHGLVRPLPIGTGSVEPAACYILFPTSLRRWPIGRALQLPSDIAASPPRSDRA